MVKMNASECTRIERNKTSDDAEIARIELRF